MFSFCGKSFSPGKAAGKVRLIHTCRDTAPAASCGDSGKEIVRLDTALAAVKDELTRLEEKIAKTDPDGAAIFGIHRMMLEDPDYTDLLNVAVYDGASAEDAARRAEETLSRLFESSGDEVLAARAADVRDITRRLLSALSGKTAEGDTAPAILVGDEILPGDLFPGGALAVVTRCGSYSSHVALLARSMGVPLLLCPDLDLSHLSDGLTAVVDADAATVFFNPDENTLTSVKNGDCVAKTDEQSVDFSALPVPLLVNIASPSEAREEIFSEAAGVGLYRTEFLYIGRRDLPSEEEQVAAYAEVLRAAKGKRVVIRTFDLGADKQSPALAVPHEENPALGLRGIRLSFRYPDAFRAQLRALLRAATEGDLAIMYPMITSAREVLAARRLVEEVAAQLEREGIPYRVPEQGVMIETPAAVMLADELARVSDFFSVGSNDLSQYALALDRENGGLDEYADPENTALLRLIRLAAQSAHKAGIPIGVCGEIASDPAFAKRLVDLGVDSLSVAPPALHSVAKSLVL